ncbi:MAG: hypothetical protein EOO40_11505, partial [Deltaproteobacteria bacterium]
MASINQGSHPSARPITQPSQSAPLPEALTPRELQTVAARLQASLQPGLERRQARAQLVAVLREVVPRYGLKDALAALGIDAQRFTRETDYAARILADSALQPLFDAIESPDIAPPPRWAAPSPPAPNGPPQKSHAAAPRQAGDPPAVHKSQPVLRLQASTDSDLLAVDGQVLAVADGANNFRLVDTTGGQLLARIELGEQTPTCVALCHLVDSRRQGGADAAGVPVLAVGDTQGGVTLYAYAARGGGDGVPAYSMRPTAWSRLKGATSPVVGLAYFHGTMVSAHARGTLHFWRPRLDRCSSRC